MDIYQSRGDIIFFNWLEKDGTRGEASDHTGIVESIDIENKKVNTIEGNSDDNCRRKSYSLESEDIMGYGTPVYKNEELPNASIKK